MKKTLISVLALIVMASVTFGQNNIKPEQFTVALTSTLILPSVNPTTFTDFSIQSDWTSGVTYAIGDYVRIIATNGLSTGADYYWCITAGTNSATYPTWSHNSDITNGASVFRYVTQRKSFTTVNIGSGRVSFGYGAAAVAGYGWTSGALGWTEKNFLGEVYAISTTSTNAVGVQQSFQSK